MDPGPPLRVTRQGERAAVQARRPPLALALNLPLPLPLPLPACQRLRRWQRGGAGAAPRVSDRPETAAAAY